jgi:hypothetical protein
LIAAENHLIGRSTMIGVASSSKENHSIFAEPSIPVIPAHPNIVEVVALLEDPGLRASQRTALKRVLHDTVHLVRKQDGTVHRFV